MSMCCDCEESSCTSTTMFTTILFILLVPLLTNQSEETTIIICMGCFVGLFIWTAINIFNYLSPRSTEDEEIVADQRWRSTQTMMHRAVNSTDDDHRHSGVIIGTVMAGRGQYRNVEDIGSVLPSSFCRNARVCRMAIRALPPVKSFISTEDKNDECDDEECPICMENFKDGELIQPFGICDHEFHSSCLCSWLHGGNTTCPVCREDLATSITDRGK